MVKAFLILLFVLAFLLQIADDRVILRFFVILVTCGYILLYLSFKKRTKQITEKLDSLSHELTKGQNKKDH